MDEESLRAFRELFPPGEEHPTMPAGAQQAGSRKTIVGIPCPDGPPDTEVGIPIHILFDEDPT